MTRLYYNDSYTDVFDANVIEASSDANQPFAVLDASYFYPTSGGQPHDTGTLGDSNVIDVRIRETDGAVLHILDKPVAEGPVHAQIDFKRRHDHMQQHTGQHILSQAFIYAASAATISFHLGAESVSIDVDNANLSERDVKAAAALANEAVMLNHEVRAWFPDPAEIEKLPLRKMPDVDGPLRVVAIGDFDYSACGGTHVARTGEVGIISVLRTEKMRRGMRIEFLAGNRARRDYSRKHATIRELSAALTCAPDDLVEAVAKLSATVTETRRALAVYRERDLDDEAAALAKTATRSGDVKVVRATFDGRPVDEVKGLALRLTTEPDVVALFGITGARTQLIFARSENVTLNLKPAFDATLAALGGGKGGGARILMGSAGPVDVETLAKALESVLSS
jgi:alanyl-tRNA synthetase